ncbi:MAG: hypothetical protein OQK50_07285 [Deltaproteobacteria bacterium]|jgi:outer membrane protein|nr:hypothetical protein [Deltaproteobacteria bacterium]MCW9050114.1 hypothetical protein [Deltaproteobacteria bacterium]
MPNKWKVLSLLSLLVLLTTNLFADELVSIKGGYQLLSPTGSIAGKVNGVGTDIDVENDLNLDDSETLTGELALQWGKSRLSFNYLPLDFSGTGTLTKTITFNGTDYLIGEEVKSDLTIDLYDIGYTYYLLNFDDLPTRFQFGLEFAVKVADVNASLKSLGLSESQSVTAPIPTIGARTRIALADFLGITGRIGYLEFDDNHFLDAEAQLEFSPFPLVGLYAGFRYFDLKIDEDDIYVETEFSGPFGGLMVRF